MRSRDLKTVSDWALASLGEPASRAVAALPAGEIEPLAQSIKEHRDELDRRIAALERAQKRLDEAKAERDAAMPLPPALEALKGRLARAAAALAETAIGPETDEAAPAAGEA